MARSLTPTDRLQGFGWDNIYSIHGGVEWAPVEQLALRAGYNYSQNPIPHETAAINISAPAVVQHHLTQGGGVKLTRRMEVSAAYYHAFEGECAGLALTPAGPMPGTEVKSVMSENSFLVQFSFATRSF